jgi:hypothetical protein
MKSNSEKFFFPSGLGVNLDLPMVQKRDLSWLIEEAEALGVTLRSEQLEMLKSEEIPVVLTGQQPGLLGGPAYVWYKAKTAVDMAKKLSLKWGKPVLPIFWIAGDDSDILECNHYEFSSGKSASVTPNDFEVGTSVRNLTWSVKEGDRLKEVFNHEIKQVVEKIKPWLKTKEWVCSFAQALSKEFPDLIFVDGGSPRVIERSQSFHQTSYELKKETEKLLFMQEKLIEKNGYKVQVNHVEGLWRGFALDEGRRYRLVENEALVSKKLTHDVLSRPLVCSVLFNVNVHVLGPSEMAYFRQIAPLFSLFGLEPPAVQLRMSVELQARDDRGFLNSLGLDYVKLKKTPWSGLVDSLSQEYFKNSKENIPDFGILTEPLIDYSKDFASKLEAQMLAYWRKRVNVFFRKEYKKSNEYKTLLNIYKRFGSGRPQERVLGWIELNSLGLYEELDSLDSLCSKLQIAEVDSWG